MNYIKQLTSAMILFAEDDRLNPSHVSLYLALFQMWNINRFRNPVSINRYEVMRVSKIGSRVTYHKCIKDLHNWNYLVYLPSHNPLKGSLVNMSIFGTTPKQVVSQPQEQVVEHLPSQEVGPFINTTNSKNNSKLNKHIGGHSRMSPPNLEKVKGFIKNDIEAEKFFNYYTSNGWKVGGKTPMKNWEASARNWILNTNKFQSKQKNAPLFVEQNKDYSIPL